METQMYQMLQKIDNAAVEWDKAKTTVQAARDNIIILNPSIIRTRGLANRCLDLIHRRESFVKNMTETQAGSGLLVELVGINFECFKGQLNTIDIRYQKLLKILHEKLDEIDYFKAKLQKTRTLVSTGGILEEPQQIPFPSAEWLKSIPLAEVPLINTQWECLDLFNRILECETVLQNEFLKLVESVNG